jgi:hypothetical protein
MLALKNNEGQIKNNLLKKKGKLRQESNEVFLGDQLFMNGVTIQSFGDCLCLYHQDRRDK